MWNVCRCCSVASECSQDIFSKYLTAEQTEVYDVMLKETFNIEMSREESHIKSNTLICERCILWLREASAFKEAVLRSERMFAEFVNDCNSKSDNLEIIKNEDVDVKSDDGTFSPEHEPSYVMKEEMKEQSNQGNTIINKQNRHKTSDRDAKACRKVKRKLNAGMIKSNDITKITEFRGNGPILRENTLKLLENSTIFVFQWHKSRYTCFCCQKPFLNLDELKNHTLEHPIKDIEKRIISQQNMPVKVDISVLNCKLCDERMINLQNLKEHLIENHDFEFKLKEDLLIPFKIEDDLKCQLCTEKFSVFRLLNIHMNRHYKKQVCHICGAAFSNLRFLNLHIYRSHSLKCKECSVSFTSKTEKRTHDFKVHEKKCPKSRFPCPNCDERYDRESLRVLHLVEKHGMRKPDYKCSVCPKSFVTKSLCNNHFKAVHKKERKHPCDVCNNMFYSKSDVARHRVTHTGEKKFCCCVCNVMFATKDSLRRHMKRTHATA